MAELDTPIHLSTLQKEVMAKIFAAPTPSLAWETVTQVETEFESNFVSAKETLEKLGLIVSERPQELTVTPEGKEAMQDAYLIDEFETLTPEGEALAQKSRTIEQPGTQESLQIPLIRSIVEGIKQQNVIKSLSKK